jgi:hypothetical protein
MRLEGTNEGKNPPGRNLPLLEEIPQSKSPLYGKNLPRDNELNL